MRKLFSIALLFITMSVCGQEIKKVEASYIYRAPETVSVEQAKQIALQRTQIEAIADAFGTNIAQENVTRVSNINGKSDIDFQNISSSDVNGEWIETIGEPEYQISYEQGMLIVTCSVKGRIRKIEHATIDLSAKILRNGTEDKFEDSDFNSGDDLFLSFQSPINGYLAVYLVDDDNNAFCLLPYRNQTDGIYKISANKHYIFFSAKNADLNEQYLVDEYTMTCEKERENNQIYIIFSPNKFIKALDNDNGEFLPREIEGHDFQKWLAKVRRTDANVVLISKSIQISK